MPVGNDVVDLQDPANQPSAIHPRFDERVFSDAELDRLGAVEALDRHRLRWTLWAARESAYKHLAQEGADAPFRPAEMTVRLAGRVPGRPSGIVEWNGREIEIRTDCRTDRVHVVTRAADGSAPVSTLWRIAGPIDRGGEASPAADPHAISAAARTLATRLLARALGLSASDVRIVPPSRTAAGRTGPRALVGGEALPADLSISHDGEWIACAVVVRKGAFRAV